MQARIDLTRVRGDALQMRAQRAAVTLPSQKLVLSPAALR